MGISFFSLSINLNDIRICSKYPYITEHGAYARVALTELHWQSDGFTYHTRGQCGAQFKK